jgi:hypothetical protein
MTLKGLRTFYRTVNEIRSFGTILVPNLIVPIQQQLPVTENVCRYINVLKVTSCKNIFDLKTRNAFVMKVKNMKAVSNNTI